MSDTPTFGRTPIPTRGHGIDEQALAKRLRDSGAIDFDKIGKMVTDLGPNVISPGDAATDYVIVVGDSIAKIYKWMPGEHAGGTIEKRTVLQNLGQNLGR
jgi:hypothetical protein